MQCFELKYMLFIYNISVFDAYILIPSYMTLITTEILSKRKRNLKKSRQKVVYIVHHFVNLSQDFFRVNVDENLSNL